MKINKKILVIIIITILIVFLAFYLSIKNRKQDQLTEITPTKPLIKTEIEGQLDIQKKYEKSKYNFEGSLPLLTVIKRAINREYVENLKVKLNINGEIQEFKDTNEGIKYFTNSEDFFLVATPKTSLIKYGLANSDLDSIIDKKYSDEEFIEMTKQFVTTNNIYRENQIEFLKIEYLKRSTLSEGLEKSNRNDAEIFAVSFIYSSSKYEIVNNISIKSPIYIEFQKDGKIFNSEFMLIDDLRASNTVYPIKNYEEFISSVGQSKIISVEGDYYSASDIKSVNDIKYIDIQDIRMAYYEENSSNSNLQPIFVIEAEIELKESSSNKAILYLPAYK